MSEWYLAHDGQQVGPYDEATVRSWVDAGQLPADTMAWAPGAAGWTPVAAALRVPAAVTPTMPGGSGWSTSWTEPGQHPATAGPHPAAVATAGTGAPGGFGAPAGTGAPGGFGAKGSVAHWLLPTGRSGLAVAAGYLGLLSLIPIIAPFSVGVGVAAVVHLRRNPSRGGRGRAWFGVVAGALGTLFLAFLLTR
jgi:hypothetical protein